ncbi:MAG: hypothetical protein DRN12_07355 [Thermoplasmata archaeon]|nr:MAG: hypothetical protein DRN12_07355 [Thermoplasmata archaeon]
MSYLESLGRFSPRINITYRCQLFSFCEYCYAKNELRNYPNDMRIEDFSKIITWFKDLFSIKIVTFLGGESTVHPQLASFFEILRERNINSFLFTNGCFDESKRKIILDSPSVTTMIFHYEPSFLREKSLRNKFFDNLEKLSKSKEIVFRFNTSNPSFEFKELIELSDRYNASIAYSFTSPSLNNPGNYYVRIEEMKRFVPQLIKFIETAYSQGIKVFSKRPLPLCIFSEDELSLMKEKSGLRSICCIGSITVNPDLSLIPAPTLTTIKTDPIKSKKDLADRVKELSEKVERLKWAELSIEKCGECKFFKNRECQGACTAYKLI